MSHLVEFDMLWVSIYWVIQRGGAVAVCVCLAHKWIFDKYTDHCLTFRTEYGSVF